MGNSIMGSRVPWIPIAIALCLALGAGWWVYQKTHSPMTVVSATGKEHKYLSAAEAGVVSGNDMDVVRRNDVTSQEWYATLPMSSLSVDPKSVYEEVYPLIKRGCAQLPSYLETLPKDNPAEPNEQKFDEVKPWVHQALKSVTDESLKELAKRVSIDLASYQGMPVDDYLRTVEGMTAVIPFYLVKETAGHDPLDVFKKQYASTRREEVAKITKLCLDDSGSFMVLAHAPYERLNGLLLDYWLRESDLAMHFKGNTVLNGYVFFRDQLWHALEKDKTIEVTAFEIAVVVENTDGRRFVVRLTYYYNYDVKKWRLLYTAIQGSYEATVKHPQLVN